MGRKAEPGIAFYNVYCSDIMDKATRLLIADQGTEAFWIWHCLQSDIYGINGYFYDFADEEELEIFAMDKCKQPLDKVQAVVASLIKRKLLDAGIYEKYGILTSVNVQSHYLHATSERRKKGTEVEMIQELILLDLAENLKGVKIVPGNKSINPGNNRFYPVQNPHSKSNSNSRVDGNTTVLPLAGKPAAGQSDFLKECYKDLPKDAESLLDFIKGSHPDFIEPYVAYWNLFAAKYARPLVKTLNDHRKKKFKARIAEKGFRFATILFMAGKSEIIKTGTWFTFDWILESEQNYTKVIEGNYSNNSKLSENEPATGELSAAAKELKAKLSGS